MSLLLHIESSSTVCSVALSNKNELIAIKELNNGYTHAENLHVFINELLAQEKIKAKDLNAISVSSGPGSYTGLRIGFSAAKGLSYALNIPLITIDTLKALTVSATKTTNEDVYYCPMLDARRMEVYCAVYDNKLNEITSPNALILDENSIKQFGKGKPIYFFGDGMPKAKTLLENITDASFIENILPGSKSMIDLAYNKYINKDFADVAYSEPFYLKEFFFHTAKK